MCIHLKSAIFFTDVKSFSIMFVHWFLYMDVYSLCDNMKGTIWYSIFVEAMINRHILCRFSRNQCLRLTYLNDIYWSNQISQVHLNLSLGNAIDFTTIIRMPKDHHPQLKKNNVDLNISRKITLAFHFWCRKLF